MPHLTDSRPFLMEVETVAERPGVLLYFDILPALDKLPHKAVGELLLKALHYAQDGIDPVFDDSALGFAWAFLKPAIDRDGVVYRDKRLRGDWLTYCRQCKRDGIEPLDFETWRERVDNGTLQAVDVALPTTNTTPASSTTPSPTHNQHHGDSAAQPPSARWERKRNRSTPDGPETIKKDMERIRRLMEREREDGENNGKE